MSQAKYTVFISSTWEDLKDEREEVSKAILEIGHIPVGMELFSAANEEQWKVIQRTIDDCDYYIVLAARRYGSMVDGISYTQKEYEYACEKGIPTLAFLLSDSAGWPEEKRDKEPARLMALERFREQLKEKLVDWWDDRKDLKAKVVVALSKAFLTYPRPGWIRASEGAGPAAASELLRLSSENAKLREQLAAKDTNTQKQERTERAEIARLLFDARIDIACWDPDRRTWGHPHTVMLAEAFNAIATPLAATASVSEISSALATLRPAGKATRAEWPVSKTRTYDTLGNLMALGLVEPKVLLHGADEKQAGRWGLTSEGLAIHRIMRRGALEQAIQNKPDEQGFSAGAIPNKAKAE